MMKFIFKLFLNKLYGCTGTLIYCTKCKSPKVKYGDSTFSNGIIGKIETYEVQCVDCGAKGVISETWKI